MSVTGNGRPGSKRSAPHDQPSRCGFGLWNWVAIIAVLVASATVAAVLKPHSPSRAPSQVAVDGRTAAPIRPTTIDLASPFAQTPAANWADGAAGIMPPPPAAVGRWSAHDVAVAERDVRQTLIAAHLDDALLVRHDPTRFLNSLAPNARPGERAALANPASRNDGGMVSLLAPDQPLLPVPVKVNGTMSVSTADNGTLVVHTNYVFAFAFAPTGHIRIDSPAQIVAIQHISQSFLVPEGSAYRPGDRGVWLDGGQSYYDQMSCGAIALGYIGPAYSDSSPPIDRSHTSNRAPLYDPNHSMDITNSCPAGHPI